jgi:protein-S-isoprenylcysteine O-methyltransferase Ste14
VRHPFRRKNWNVRLLPVAALAAALLWVAEPAALGWAVGSSLLALGLGLRAWGAGHLVKTDVLTCTGPYAHLRHPLYAGTFLAALGFGAMAGVAGLALVVGIGVPVFLVYYFPYKERIESARLERRYGEAYAAYRAAVPALVPSWRSWTPPWPVGEATGRWSLRRYLDNDELGTAVGCLAGVALLALRPALAS